jgi:hypothetical protein
VSDKPTTRQDVEKAAAQLVRDSALVPSATREDMLHDYVIRLMRHPAFQLTEKAEEYSSDTCELAVVDRSEIYLLGDKALVQLMDEERNWPETPHPQVVLQDAIHRFAVTFLVLLPDGWYEKSLSMRMPPHGLTFNFGWYTIEADSVEYDEETDSCLIMDDPALYDPDQEGEAEALRDELVAHGFTFREPPDGIRRCRVCGCTDDHACIDTVTCEPCHWVEPDLCSVCADKGGGHA